MTCILYRKSSISLAFQTNSILRGCNLSIWYGFSDNNQHEDIIIDASIIKKYLTADLAQFDHSCVYVDSADDLVSSMIILGKKLYVGACQYPNFIQLCVENEYGDIVVISRNRVVVHKQFVRFDEGACFCCTTDNLFSYLGTSCTRCVLSSVKNYTNEQLNNLLKGSLQDCCAEITCFDDVTSTAMTYQGNNLRLLLRVSVSCIKQFAHKIDGLPSSEKCGHLHGHTYKCRASAIISPDEVNVNLFIKSFGALLVTTLNDTFLSGAVQQSTVENAVRYIAKRLSTSHKLAFVELSETPNIMAGIFFDA